MPYLFLNKYCKVTTHLPKEGIITLTGWIIQADKYAISLIDEDNNYHLIKREQMAGSIVVLEGQKEMNVIEMQMCEGGN